MASSSRKSDKSEGFVEELYECGSMEGIVENLDECGSMEGVIDRFSGLPEKIMHKVLCSLNVEDLVRVMLVSKTCYNWCMSVPVLWVNNCCNTSDVGSLYRYMSLVGNYLSNRFKERKKVRLNMNWKWQFVEETQKTKKGKRVATKKPKKEKAEHTNQVFGVHQFYSRTVSYCDTEVLTLYLISPERKPQELPAFFFESNLKVIVVETNLCKLGFLIFPVPSYSKVEKLTLRSSILDDRQLYRVVSILPSLKSLSLHDCRGLSALVLQSSSLEHLRIVNQNIVELEELIIYCEHNCIHDTFKTTQGV